MAIFRQLPVPECVGLNHVDGDSFQMGRKLCQDMELDEDGIDAALKRPSSWSRALPRDDVDDTSLALKHHARSLQSECYYIKMRFSIHICLHIAM